MTPFAAPNRAILEDFMALTPARTMPGVMERANEFRTTEKTKPATGRVLHVHVQWSG